jgi:hypothetical protein
MRVALNIGIFRQFGAGALSIVMLILDCPIEWVDIGTGIYVH